MRVGCGLGWLAGMVCAVAGAQAVGVPAARVGDRPGANVVVERVLREWPEGRISDAKGADAASGAAWNSDEGVLLDGMIAVWRATGDGRLFEYVHAAVDHSIDKEGVIHVNGKQFPAEAHALDDVEMGRSVVVLYRVLQESRYYTAAKFLYEQMQQQPKTRSGGYWHQQMYPNQMWLDGSYMAEPFLVSYARAFHEPKELDAVATQLLMMDTKMRDRQSGLLRHGWDESKQMDWADKKTGLSPEAWARAMGWYAMALVDVLERMPTTDPQRAAVAEVAQRTLRTVARYQDASSGLWWQVMDKPGARGNYLEASASCMFVYALAKGVRLDLLPFTFEPNIVRGWAGIQTKFVKEDGTLSGTVKSAGLGGKPYRSGTFEYYTSEAVGDNDAKGVGAYLLALSEMTQRLRVGELMHRARGKTVLMDGWFNAETRKNADGQMEPFHYKFNDDAGSGYSAVARMYQQYGMRTEVLDHAPRADDLKGVAIYTIVSPESPAVNPNAHLMDKESADAIEAWVKAGGVLVEMENDAEHADQVGFDLLSDAFGLHFNAVTRDRVAQDRVAQDAAMRNSELDGKYAVVSIPAGSGGIFKDTHRVLMVGTCTLTVSGPAKALIADKGDVLMAVSHEGKGLVFASAGPWTYNEYVDGRQTPLDEDNFAAGLEWTRWLVVQAVGR